MSEEHHMVSQKAQLIMTMQLGAEWAMYGIKVNAIAPGWIETEMVKRPLRSGILDAKKILSVSPIGRFGKVEEIASLATFLASKESDYIVGQVLCRWRLEHGYHAGWTGLCKRE